MFTMPLWTGVFSALIDKETLPWRRRDFGLALISLGGVTLVARPWDATVASTYLGFAAALGFSALGGLLNVLMKATSLRAVDSWRLGA